jgi:hypothetical protein
LDLPEDDPEVVAARQAMLDHPKVKGLIAEAATWPGYPLKRHNDSKHTLHKLAVRADDPGIDEVMEKVMAHRSPEGAFQTVVLVPKAFGGTGKGMWTWMLCDTPTVLYALLGFGLGEHPAVQRAVEHLASLVRDNGWPCASSPEFGKFRGPGRKADPCPYVNLIALKALSKVPEMRDSVVCRKGAEMLLGHWERRAERKI